MSTVGVQFVFEKWGISLDDGTEFVPAKEARQRWIVGPFREELMDGDSFRVLYELADFKFIQLDLQCCYFNDGRIPHVPRGQWWSPLEPSAIRLPPVNAIQWFVDAGLPVPKVLDGHLPEYEAFKSVVEAEPVPRPLEFWAHNVAHRMRSDQPAHRVDVLAIVERIARIAVACVHQLKEGRWLLDGPGGRLYFLWLSLVARFPVDSQYWWGPIDALPPAEVGLCDLRWPTETDGIRAAIGRMQELLAGPLSLHRGREYELYPTAAEVAMAEDAMRACTDELERLTITLRRGLDELNRTPCSTPLQLAKLKRPPQVAIDAFRLLQEGKKQEEVAKILAAQHGYSDCQGNVSRWNTQVKQYLEASGALPPMSDAVRKAIHHVDPKHLDMGPNTSGRTPRQKGGKRGK